MSGDVDDTTPLTINPSAIDGFASDPNVLTSWSPSRVGALSGVAPDDVLFADSYGNASGAAWNIGNLGGRFVVLMDINWAENSYEDATTMPEVAQNIATLLSS